MPLRASHRSQVDLIATVRAKQHWPGNWLKQHGYPKQKQSHETQDGYAMRLVREDACERAADAIPHRENALGILLVPLDSQALADLVYSLDLFYGEGNKSESLLMADIASQARNLLSAYLPQKD